MDVRPLFGKYTIREMTKLELMPFLQQHASAVFEHTVNFDAF